ncbi:hypothetical protein [Candidatus Tisiphia endosymbiont of Sialis lutaria]
MTTSPTSPELTIYELSCVKTFSGFIAGLINFNHSDKESLLDC